MLPDKRHQHHFNYILTSMRDNRNTFAFPNCHLKAHMYKCFFLLLTLILLAGCNGKSDNYTAYFGGEIQHPTSPYVILSKDNVPLDTLQLDKDNRFFVKLDSLAPGMYSFQHEPEYQYVYFDKNDSIMLSVNANDFDNSLVFSGRGDQKNNFLMELYLLNEADRAASYSIYEKPFPAYKKSIDSAYALRKAFYQKKKNAISWSEGFDLFAKTRVDMSYYSKKEYYPVVHARMTGKDIRPQLPVNFYAFRKNIDFNNHQLLHYSPFARYVNAMLNNIAITRYFKNGSVNEDLLRDNITKLNVADSIFKDDHLKNEILNNLAFAYLLEDQEGGNNQKFLERYLQLSTDKSPSNEVRRIAEALRQLKPGMPLPTIALVDTKEKLFDFKSIKTQTVFVFWTSCARNHMDIVAQRVRQLRQEFPGTTFIAVNVDGDKEWKAALGHLQIDNVLQLRARQFPELKNKWAFTRINKAIIVRPDGRIKNAFGNLMEPSFTALLK